MTPLLFFAILLVSAQPETNTSDRLLEKAQAIQAQIADAKREGRETTSFYRSLLAVCVQLRKAAPGSLPLCLDEGHAASFAGDWPHALLAYRLAQRLAPANATVAERLRIVRERLLLPQEPASARDEAAAALATNSRLRASLLLLAFLLYGGAWLRIASRSDTRGPGFGLPGAVQAMTVALTIIAGLSWADEYRQRLGSQSLVVIKRGEPVVLREGNGLSYPAATEERLRAGSEAVLLNRRGDWLQVRAARGMIGWIPSTVCEVE